MRISGQLVVLNSRNTDTHRERCIRIDLILGSDSKASVAVSSSPGEVYSRLKLVIHLLVDGTTKFSAIISEGKLEYVL